MIRQYLCYVGNQMASTIGNLKEFALFCALMIFSPDDQTLATSGQIPVIRNSYEAALTRLLGPGSEMRIIQFHSLMVTFRRGVDIFYAHMRDIPSRCSTFHNIANSLVQEFQHQFLTIKPASGCSSPTTAATTTEYSQ